MLLELRSTLVTTVFPIKLSPIILAPVSVMRFIRASTCQHSVNHPEQTHGDVQHPVTRVCCASLAATLFRNSSKPMLMNGTAPVGRGGASLCTCVSTCMRVHVFMCMRRVLCLQCGAVAPLSYDLVARDPLPMQCSPLLLCLQRVWWQLPCACCR